MNVKPKGSKKIRDPHCLRKNTIDLFSDGGDSSFALPP